MACSMKHHQKAIDRHKGAEAKERKKAVREREEERLRVANVTELLSVLRRHF